jgi:EmrB/QacA subfamily drug resistance transporter
VSAGAQTADSQTTNAPAEARQTRTGLLLAVCCLAQFMVILDLSIVNVALPSIQVSLRFSAADLQWVVDAYAIVFAGFLMLAGRAVDIVGQRQTFLLALTVFGVASLGGGVAPTSTLLIVARALQGFGGALMAASSLAIITSSFAAGPARHRAIALWGAMNGAGGAAGTLLGGVITQEVSWRWVLLINAPIAAVAMFAAVAVVQNHPSGRQRPGFDLGGAVLLTGGLLITAYGGVTAGDDGWGSAAALVPLALGVGLVGAFLWLERRVKAPLLPLQALTRPLRLINLIVLLFSAALFPMWYVGSLYMQQVLALSPLDTGLCFLPMALTIFACASQAGKVVSRAGVRPVLGGGLLLLACGLALLARISDSGSPIQYIVLPGILTAVGIGFSIVPSTIAATQTAGAAQAGLASGLVNTARQVGGGLGLAILISIATQLSSHLIGASHPVAQSLTDGFRVAYLIGAGLVAVAALLTFTMLPAATGPGQARAGRSLLALVASIAVAFAVVDFAIPRSHAALIGAYTTKGAYTFVSAPGLHPPEMTIQQTTPSGQLPGYIMVANFYDVTRPPIVGQSGPLILDASLNPVWFRPVPVDDVASNLEAQTYEGHPVLSWWQGDVTETGAINSGEDVVVNDHYQTVATLRGADGWVLTLHSMVIQGHDAWVTANKNVQTDLSGVGGVNHGVLTDSAIQEYDLRTGRLLYTWKASNHIPLHDSYAVAPPNGFPWDAYHVNSVVPYRNGTFLVSMRNTWAVYLVDIRTGRILWTLGGKHSTFTVPASAHFEWQHDAELHSSTTVSLFDDHCCEITGAGQYLSATGPSRGLVLKLNLASKTASLVSLYSHGADFESKYMGNTQLLPDGDVFVGWGDIPYLSEFSKSGRLLFDASFPGPDASYRAYLQHWVGLPAQPPSGAARTRNAHTTVYASWNGSTELRRWRVLGVAPDAHATAIATSATTGFETAIAVRAGYDEFRVQALNGPGAVIGTSSTFDNHDIGVKP